MRTIHRLLRVMIVRVCLVHHEIGLKGKKPIHFLKISCNKFCDEPPNTSSMGFVALAPSETTDKQATEELQHAVARFLVLLAFLCGIAVRLDESRSFRNAAVKALESGYHV